MSAKSRLLKTTMEQVRQIVKMEAAGERISAMVQTVNVSWPTAYQVLVDDRYKNIGILSQSVANQR